MKRELTYDDDPLFQGIKEGKKQAVTKVVNESKAETAISEKPPVEKTKDSAVNSTKTVIPDPVSVLTEELVSTEPVKKQRKKPEHWTKYPLTFHTTLSQENYDFIYKERWELHMEINSFINHVIEEYRNKLWNAELMQRQG